MNKELKKKLNESYRTHVKNNESINKNFTRVTINSFGRKRLESIAMANDLDNLVNGGAL
jgi:hypothetical protein